MNKLDAIAKQIENAMSKSRGLNDADFVELLNNIELIKINIIQLRRKLNIKDFELYETKKSKFQQFLNNEI